MALERRVRIIECASGQVIDGTLRPATLSDKVLWTQWHGKMPPGEEDAHWEWDELIDLGLAMPDRFEVYALEAAKELQGLRMLEIAGEEVELYGVHALRLSTAPWNRLPERRYRGVGSLLVGVAILRSVELNRGGRIYCQSLRGAEGFHERNGMIELGEPSYEGLRRFRFEEDGAARFIARLEEEGLLL